MTTLEENAKRYGHRSYHTHRIRNGGRCIWLSPEGRRCRATATWAGSMHGDSELQDSAWVWVEACDRHAEANSLHAKHFPDAVERTGTGYKFPEVSAPSKEEPTNE